MNLKLVAKVVHFYGKIGVAILECLAPLKLGQRVHFKGNSTDFEQVIDSMQYEHVSIREAEIGQQVGLKVIEKVREGDSVYLVEE